jgi:cardiolipin synthase
MNRLSWPNRVTITRILLIAPFVICLLHLQDPAWEGWARYAALGIFALMAFSDGVDGYLARRLRQRTQLGAFLDPMADKVLITCAMIMLGYSGTAMPGKKIPDIVVVTAVGKDFVIVVGFMIVFFLTGQAVVQARPSGKVCTAVQLLTVLSVLLWPDLPRWLNYLPDTLWWLSVVLAVIAALDYVRVGGRLLNSQGAVRQA